MIDRLPRRVRDAVSELVGALEGRVVALVAYGAEAFGAYHPDESELHVAVVAGQGSLEALGPPLRRAWRRARVEPWIVRQRELPGLCDVFATRVREIQRRHVLLVGQDVFAPLRVERSALRLRLEQELRNHQIRMRRERALDDAGGLARAMYVVSRSLEIELALVEELAGGEAPSARDAIAAAAAGRLDVDGATVEGLLAFAHARQGDVRALVEGLERVLDAAVVWVDGLDRSGDAPRTGR